jgi:hypothetical protein
MLSSVDVTLTGPPADPAKPNGPMRGLRFIDVGFIQTGTVTKRQFTVANGDVWVARDQESLATQKAEDQKDPYPMLDTINYPKLKDPNDPNSDEVDDPATAANERPWYNMLGNNTPGSGRLRGAYGFPWPKLLANSPVDDGVTPLSQFLSVSDTPWQQIVSQPKAPKSVKLQLEFSVILAAHTIEDVNGSAGVYFNRASAGWIFNGDGNIVNGNRWQPALEAGNYLNDVQRSASGDLTPTNAGTIVLEPPLGRDTRVMNQVLGGSERNGTRPVRSWRIPTTGSSIRRIRSRFDREGAACVGFVF